MDIKTINKSFHVLPFITIIKNINPLSDAAKKSFDSNWDYYYSVKIGWLLWDYEF